VLSIIGGESGGGTTNTCSADSSDGFAASCSSVAVATATVPGQENTLNVYYNDSGTILSGIHAAVAPGSCTGSDSTICADTEVTVTWWFPGQEGAICLYGPSGGTAGSCGAPTSAYTLADLAKAGTLPATGGSTYEWTSSSEVNSVTAAELTVTFELSPTAPTSDEGATASIPLTATFSAGS